MPELTQKQFDVIADLMQAKEPARTAAFLVLVKGRTNKEAMAKTGVSPQSLCNTVVRYRQKHEMICEAYGIERARRLTV